jgi:hypothetical protein
MESIALTTEMTQDHYVSECDSVDCRFVNFVTIKKEAVRRVLFEFMNLKLLIYMCFI